MVLLGIFGLTFVSTGKSDFLSSLTGAVTSETTTVSVTINSAPKIIFVSRVYPQTISEATTVSVYNITFNVTDNDGFGDINNQSAQIRVNISGTDRFNTSCVNITPFTNSSGSSGMSFNCSFSVWYFDPPGNWTINVSINDTAGVYAENLSTTFELYQTTAMVMYPNALTWPTLELGRTNQTSNNDPVRINNTGNKNINVGGITVAGYNLQGVTTTTQFINAENFSVAPVNFTGTGVGTAECNGTQMFNGTSGAAAPRAIFAANITRGNNSVDDGTTASGQEELWFCLRTVPSEVSRQTYDTSGTSTSSWTVAVS